ncbi:MAG: hypothetical protein QM662_14125 [Gordonia sp. (in: high G+C Gram-positive bacteria)]
MSRESDQRFDAIRDELIQHLVADYGLKPDEIITDVVVIAG